MTRSFLGSRTSRPVNLAIVLLLYSIVCLVSTTGVDVLMLLTAMLMVWATVREFAHGVLATVLANALAMVVQSK